MRCVKPRHVATRHVVSPCSVTALHDVTCTPWDSPIIQIIDEKYGGTVIDTGKRKYDREVHPDYEWIKLD